MDQDQVVEIIHDKVPESKDNPPRVSKTSFESVWKERGWKIAPKVKKEATPNG